MEFKQVPKIRKKHMTEDVINPKKNRVSDLDRRVQPLSQDNEVNEYRALTFEWVAA